MKIKFILSVIFSTVLCVGTVYSQVIPPVRGASMTEREISI